jgi:hypothetical protein
MNRSPRSGVRRIGEGNGGKSAREAKVGLEA